MSASKKHTSHAVKIVHGCPTDKGSPQFIFIRVLMGHSINNREDMSERQSEGQDRVDYGSTVTCNISGR